MADKEQYDPIVNKPGRTVILDPKRRTEDNRRRLADTIRNAPIPPRVQRGELVDSPPGQGEARREYLQANKRLNDANIPADIEDLNAWTKNYKPSSEYARGGRVLNKKWWGKK